MNWPVLVAQGRFLGQRQAGSRARKKKRASIALVQFGSNHVVKVSSGENMFNE
jgi:hypothetical protein